MNGEFLQGIAQGIFGRQEELRQEQKARDAEQKLQTIQLLSSLAPSVEAGSLPNLMKHLGDTIGIKGQMRKFWDVFSGAPDLSIEQQLGEKVREISSSLVGPEQAKQFRETYKQNLLQPYREAGTRPRTVAGLDYMSPPSLQGKMVFRDPRSEESEEVEKRSRAQLENALRLQEEKGRLDLLAQQERDRFDAKTQEVQTRLQFNKELGSQIKFYKSNGVKDPGQARRLALNDYSDLALQLGISVPPLSPDDNKMLDKVQSQINRLNQLTLKGMGGGGRSESGNIQTWIELSDGSVVPADKVNFDRLPPGVVVKRMFTTINGQPIAFGGGGGLGGGAFTLEEAQRQIEVMRKAGRSTQQINSAIGEMIKDNPKMKSELEKLRVTGKGVSFEEFEKKKKEVGLGNFQIGPSLSPEEREMLNPEETRRRVELGVMKSEVDWLRSQLDYAEKQMAIAPGVVQRESLQKQVNDLKRRLKYAEGELNKKETGVTGAVPPPTPVRPTTPTPVPYDYIKR